MIKILFFGMVIVACLYAGVYVVEGVLGMMDTVTSAVSAMNGVRP